MKMKLLEKFWGSQGKEPQVAGQISATDRHMYEYHILPSAAGCAPEILFTPGYLDRCIVNKGDVSVRRFIDEIVVRRYDAGTALISVLQFPSPQEDSDLVFAASVMRKEQNDANEEGNACPYYFLAAMPEGNVLGEVLTDKDDYPYVLYEPVSEISITEFMNKVIEKSELGTMVDDLRLM